MRPLTGREYRFTMLPWDMNSSQEASGPELCSPTAGLLSGVLLSNPGYEQMYFDILSKFLKKAGSKKWLTARLDAAESLLGSAISAEEVEGLRFDIASRIVRLESELASAAICQ